MNATYHYEEGNLVFGGRVEVCHDNTYHPVCGEGWTDNDATVVCRYRGYRYPSYRKNRD